jgi:putative ABC transport system permease protein
VAAGTALAVNVLVVQASVAHSVDTFARELGGPAELRVVGAVRRGGLEPSLVDAVTATEGVGAVVPLVQGVTIVDAPGEDRAARAGDERPVVVLGIDCRAMALAPGGDPGAGAGAAGGACDDAALAALGDRPLFVGAGVGEGSLRTPAGPVPLGDAPPLPDGLVAGLDDVAGGEVVVFTLPTAQELLGRGDRVDVAYVLPDPAGGGAAAGLARTLADVVGDRGGVLSADEGPPEVAAGLADLLPMFTLMALFALGTGGMLVFNTASLSVEERRRDLAVLGALGGTPRVVAATTLAEAVAVGAAGGALGAAGGWVVAGPIVASLSGYTQRLVGIPLEVHVSGAALAVGLVLGTVLSLVAAAVPVRRAVRADAAAELSGRGRRAEAAAPATRRRVALLAAVALAGLALVWLGNRGGGLEPWQVPAGGLGFAVMAIFTILVGANVAAPVIRPLGRLVRGRAAEQLAVANLTRDPRRTGVMVAAVGAAVTTAFVTAGYGNGVRAAIAEDVVANLDGVSVAAVGVGANANLDVGVPPDVIDGLAALPESGATYQGATVLAGARAEDMVSVVAFQDLWFDDGDDAVRGTLDVEAFEEGRAIVNATLARDEGLRPGDDVSLPTPDGPVDVPVLAVTSGGGASGRTVQVPWELHRRLYGPVPPRSVDVAPAPGVTPAELDAAITAAGLDAEVTVRTPGEVVAQAARSADAQLAPFRTLQQGLLAVSFVAVLSTLLLVGVQRRREYGVLGALGMEPPTLARMVLAEGGAVALGAIALGVGGGLLVLYAITLVAPLLIGFATPFTPDWPPYATAAATALAATLLASAWPAHRASRTPPLDALRDE